MRKIKLIYSPPFQYYCLILWELEKKFNYYISSNHDSWFSGNMSSIFFLNAILLIIIRCVKWTKAILEIIPNSLAFQIFHRNIITSTEQNCVLKSKIFLESHKLKGVFIYHISIFVEGVKSSQLAAGSSASSSVSGSASGSASGFLVAPKSGLLFITQFFHFW